MFLEFYMGGVTASGLFCHVASLTASTEYAISFRVCGHPCGVRGFRRTGLSRLCGFCGSWGWHGGLGFHVVSLTASAEYAISFGVYWHLCGVRGFRRTGVSSGRRAQQTGCVGGSHTRLVLSCCFPSQSKTSGLGGTHSKLAVWAARAADWYCFVVFPIRFPPTSNVRRKPSPV